MITELQIPELQVPELQIPELQIPTTIEMATNLTSFGSGAPVPADAGVRIGLTNGKAAPAALAH